MDTKLTLNIDKRVVSKAKVVAKQKGKSLSALVENYLRVLSTTSDDLGDIKISPRLKSLSGLLKGKYAVDFDYKEVVSDYLAKKYLK